MPVALYLPEIVTSRYDALRTFSDEVADAARARGVLVNPPPDPQRPAIYMFFNMIKDRESLTRWMGVRSAHTAVLQWMVDHPFHASAPLVDELAPFNEYRYLSVADDDLHLMQLRWPQLRKGVVWHGVSDGAVVSPDTIAPSHTDAAQRDIDVLVTGSIHTRAELEQALAIVPANLRPSCQHLVQLRLQYPQMSFGQACDITMPHSVLSNDSWDYLAGVFRATTAWLNRERRLRVLRALRGLRVTVLGGESWREHLDTTMTYAGQVPMRDIPSWMRRAKVCIALNPAQFTQSFSERLLQGLASGSACVTDDRLWVREQFGAITLSPHTAPQPGAAIVDVANLDQLRARVDELLRDPASRIAHARAGHAVVAARHRWAHRLDTIFAMAGLHSAAAA